MSIKVCVVGPQEGGKTLLCKMLAETPTGSEYSPTAGLRIQEVERRIGTQMVSVQLWDCSGDFKYQGCFPALSLGIDGLVMVYNPDQEGKEPELEKWFQVFSQQGDAKLSSAQCLIIGLQTGGTPGRPRAAINGKLKRLPNTIVSMNGDMKMTGQQIGQELDKLLTGIVAQKREMEENSVMN